MPTWKGYSDQQALTLHPWCLGTSCQNHTNSKDHVHVNSSFLNSSTRLEKKSFQNSKQDRQKTNNLEIEFHALNSEPEPESERLLPKYNDAQLLLQMPPSLTKRLTATNSCATRSAACSTSDVGVGLNYCSPKWWTFIRGLA